MKYTIAILAALVLLFLVVFQFVAMLYFVIGSNNTDEMLGFEWIMIVSLKFFCLLGSSAVLVGTFFAVGFEVGYHDIYKWLKNRGWL